MSENSRCLFCGGEMPGQPARWGGLGDASQRIGFQCHVCDAIVSLRVENKYVAKKMYDNVQHMFNPLADQTQREGIPQATPEDFASSSASHGAPVYIAGRTFWDWLDGAAPRMRPKNIAGFLGGVLFCLFAAGLLFFTEWFQHFGEEWARAAVSMLSTTGAVICLAVGLYCLIWTFFFSEESS